MFHTPYFQDRGLGHRLPQGCYLKKFNEFTKDLETGDKILGPQKTFSSLGTQGNKGADLSFHGTPD